MAKSTLNNAVKNKNEKVKNLSIKLDYKEEIDKINLSMIFNQVIEPYMRNRSSRNVMYDPLSTYKKTVEKKLKEKLEEVKYVTDLPLGKAFIKLTVYLPFAKSTTIKQKILGEQKEILPLKKPDIDNILKTIMDIFNEIIWKDDIQIYKVEMEKYYSEFPRTEVFLDIHKKDVNRNLGRSTKEDIETWNKIQSTLEIF